MTLQKKVIVCFVLIFLLNISIFSGIRHATAIENDLPISIEVDDKIELLGVISLLDKISDYFACEIFNTVFKRDAVEWFKKYQNHPAVLSYHKLVNGNYNDSQCREFMLELGDLPDLKIPENLSPLFQKDEFLTWRIEIESFCETSKFQSFLTKERDLYQQIPEQFTLPCQINDDLDKILTIFNEKKMSIRFILSPLLFQENQYKTIQNKEETQFIFLFGLSGIDNGRLLFASKETQTYFVRDLLLRNMSGIVLSRFSGNIAKLEPLLDPIKCEMASIGIKTWEECFNEHFFLSIQIYLFAEKPFEEMNTWRKKGFRYLAETLDLIQQYDQYRSYFPSLHSFIPRVLTQYESILRSQK